MMGFDDWVLKYWPVIAFVLGLLLSGLGAWIAWSSRKQFVTQDQFGEFRRVHDDEHEKLEEALAKGEREFTLIKTELEHLPKREDLDEINSGLAALGATMAALKEAVEGVKVAVAGVNDTIQTLLGHELAEARDAKFAAAAKAGK